MTRQIPPGPHDVYCPLWRKRMSAVCHTCAWYVETQAKSKATGEVVTQWQCAMPAALQLQSHMAQAVREAGAETEALRNELALTSANTMAAAEAYQMIVHQREQGGPKLIGGGPC